MKERHLQLYLSKTELLVVPASPFIQKQIQLETTQLMSTKLGVLIDDQLTFKVHVALIIWSCGFVLYNIRKIRPV